MQEFWIGELDALRRLVIEQAQPKSRAFKPLENWLLERRRLLANTT
jgi:hypothetical protein